MNTRNLKTVLCATITMPILFACASEGGTKTAGERTNACPPNRTHVCEERVGQVQKCSCVHKDDMRDIYDLRGDRH